MPEYISRDAALTVLDWDCASQDALNAIKAIPAADVVDRKFARWKGAGLGDYYCSMCNETYSIGAERVKNWHYCPYCGAVMDGGQDDV